MNGPIVNDQSLRRLLYLLMFLSGLCSLMYQIVWTRMMTLVFGITVYAVSAVLCAFMLGLALGNFIFGRFAEKVRRPVMVFGFMEIGIGVFAAIFPLLLKGVTPLFIFLHREFFAANYTLFSLARFAVILPLLVIPTALMGGNLPLISQFFIHSRKEVGKDLSSLYSINTLGAVIGAFLVGFVFLARLGMDRTIWLAAGVNILIGSVAFFIGRNNVVDHRHDDESAQEELVSPPVRAKSKKGKNAKKSDGVGETAGPLTVKALILTAFVSGFASLALEVLWTRALVVNINNSTYAFSAILITFLVGLAVGSWVLSLFVAKLRRPVSFLAFVEIGIGLWIMASFYLIVSMPSIVRWLKTYIPDNTWSGVIQLILSQTAIIFLFPTFLMGMGLPLIVQLLTRSSAESGRLIGRIFGINTLGTVLGAFFAGFVFIPVFGVRTALLIIAALYLLVGVALLAAEKTVNPAIRYTGYIVAGVAILLAPALIPDDFFKNDFAKRFGRIIFYEEDITDTVFVVDPLNNDGSPNKALRDVSFADGRANGGHRTKTEDRFYAHLPLLLHPDPQDVLAVGVCSGNTAGAASLHKRIKSFENVELSKGVVNAVAHIETNYGVFHTNNDPRVKLFVEDGRNYLLGTAKKYDVININPPYVNTAGVVFLYTEDFLRLCLSRLRPGGIMTHFIEPDKLTQIDLKRLIATWTKVFPHCALFNSPKYYSLNLVGSADPIRIHLKTVRDSLAADPNLVEKLKEDNLDDPLRIFAAMLMGEEKMREFAQGAVAITDDMTRIDFSSPKSQFAGFGYYLTLRGLFKPKLSQHEFKEWMKGGWASLATMVNQAEYAANHVDWTGITSERKQADTDNLLLYRKERIALYNSNYGISVAITE